MKNPEIKSLFKYKPLNQYTLDIIANNRIYYPKPESFNDPFDTQCSFKNSSAIVQSKDLNKIKKAFPNEVSNEILAYTRKDLTAEIDSFKDEIKDFGILSLAEDEKDILMWSHYADDHKGVCIELERTDSNELGDPKATRKVAYTKSYPSMNVKSLLSKDGHDNSLMRVLYTKSEHWSYEREWRNFQSDGGKVYPIPGKILSITFGARASEMDIDIVKKLVGNSIPLFHAQLKENEFGIKLKKIT
ncbi:DUF2971 domain-containing protein [Shewanella sp. Isolate7]|uniref:DUF2971 domain-containing protein n=1 Tax=Shewanella sp. Isolate7 TaxID=2908528 RepID=UPI001EFE063B|nr:DUF2971 domain-containing protein [Shewanella sp. Isolate7]MCG9720391.1 DUF2971 domain-containing protein [Shewanella sp. Isolate7]